MKKNKILLISASTGSGHVKAADALKKTANLLFPDLLIEHIDMMDYITKPMKKTIIDFYDIMAKKAPELWGLFYKKTNSPKLAQYLQKMPGFFNQFNSASFFKYILNYKPTHILCTNFLPVYAIAEIQKKNKLNAKISLLMTDYFSHDMQIAKNIDHFFVPTEKTKYHLIDYGIRDNNITVSGIPVDPVFYSKKNLTGLRKKYNAKADKINLLILSGGQGLIDISGIIKKINESNARYKIFAIAGNNKKLQSKLDKLEKYNNVELHVIGWTNNMDEYMRIADYVITKPGGLSITECIVLNKPIIAISPIPGQEDCNAEYLLENNFGVVARASSDLLYYLENTKVWITRTKRLAQKPATEKILNKLINL